MNSELMQTKFYSLIAYFMVALYLNSYFNQKIQDFDDEQQFKEKYREKLLNFGYGKTKD